MKRIQRIQHTDYIDRIRYTTKQRKCFKPMKQVLMEEQFNIIVAVCLQITSSTMVYLEPAYVLNVRLNVSGDFLAN